MIKEKEKKGLGRGSCDRLKTFVSGLFGDMNLEYKMLRETGAIPQSKNYNPEPYKPRVFT